VTRSGEIHLEGKEVGTKTRKVMKNIGGRTKLSRDSRKVGPLVSGQGKKSVPQRGIPSALFRSALLKRDCLKGGKRK